MLIKICGIQDKNIAQVAVEAGAEAIGLVFATSPRQVTPPVAKKIIQSLPEVILKVGVFVNAPLATVRDIAQYCALTTLQFHGQESVDYCHRAQQLGLPIIKAIKVNKKGQFFPDPGEYRGVVSSFLADTYQPGKEGGSGKTFPWQNLEAIKSYGSVILAGGLRPDNVYQALNITRPQGVDVSSGVETEGTKDEYKIRKFIQEVRRWEDEQKSRNI